MKQNVVVVDSFTAEKFKGNPAAVCVLEESRDERWMQQVAREMNLSETAFVQQTEDGYRLRWFTPVEEVDLCGHATLAAAHVLWETGNVGRSSSISFFTRSGLLTASRDGEWIELDFPTDYAKPTEKIPELAAALDIPIQHVSLGGFDVLVETDREGYVRECRPDMKKLCNLPVSQRGVIVTSRAEEGSSYDFVSRAFFPLIGIEEDPVTGSAHCLLGTYWREKLGKDDLVGYQASARGGFVRVHVRGERVLLGGQAVTVMRGELL
ncbi:PhzF family phenazine biosynthesis protein [Aneurinibacillus uraniidurans]|uniref:PhzF family phenazine biosynthesis protein n=1 Tax=Aneurinibacillus uraniidurans TaxID=2966586 RepID=UPI00234A6663|nr:PhzF family phenazine biosynthesis protein [Aneurinibacillus sp. B1]WCN36849.1 PhzF family phenazine biosynthesis protein [Aneurinibacillus sp. B1]